MVIQRRVMKSDDPIGGIETAPRNVDRPVDLCADAAVGPGGGMDHLLMIAGLAGPPGPERGRTPTELAALVRWQPRSNDLETSGHAIATEERDK